MPAPFVNQEGGNMASLGRSCGGLNKFHKIRILTVVIARFLLPARTKANWFHSFHAIFRV
jgi:hypothetical protein